MIPIFNLLSNDNSLVTYFVSSEPNLCLTINSIVYIFNTFSLLIMYSLVHFINSSMVALHVERYILSKELNVDFHNIRIYSVKRYYPFYILTLSG